MSRRQWSRNLERRLLSQQQNQLVYVLQRSLLRDDSSDDDSDNDMTDAVVHSLYTNILDLDERVNGFYEDPTIEWGQKKTIDDFDSSQFENNFRFRKNDLKDFADRLWPRISAFLQGNRDKVVLSNRYTAQFETCLLVYLYKMHRPIRLRPDCERFFGLRLSHLSHIIRTFGDALYLVADQYLTNPRIWQPYFPKYAAIIEQKVGNFLTHAWGFIDATFRNVCRPSLHPQPLYSGYKKCMASSISV